MDESIYTRTEQLVGKAGMARLRGAYVAVCGLGGVGSYAFEALVRAGVGRILAIDGDVVAPSNLNRQLVAYVETIGAPKAEVALDRAKSINPDVRVEPVQVFLDESNIADALPEDLDFAIDAIDTLQPKVHLIRVLYGRGRDFVSSMGAARRLEPTGIEVEDLARVTHCPLARRVRRALRDYGIHQGVACVCARKAVEPLAEPAAAIQVAAPPGKQPGPSLGSLSYVPGIMGLTAAGVAIQHLLRRK